MTDSAGEAARYLTRNAVDALPEGELERQLAKGRPLRVKLGVDPTTPDIHLGHTVVLRKLREFQDLGHQVVLIVGDYTARVGDPSGRSSMRPQADPGEIDAQRRDLRGRRPSRCSTATPPRCAATASGSTCRWRTCSGWRAPPRSPSCSSATTSPKRYAAGEPISILELLYPLLQGYDSVAIRSDVELGGDRPEVQRAARARDPEGLRRGAAVDPRPCRSCRASTASRRCPSRSATTSA